MDPALEADVSRAADPRLIPGIYNYCNGWCERCPFTERCLTFRDMQPQPTFARIEGWCEKHGIDLDALRKAANSEDSLSGLQDNDEAIERDPLYQLARTYTRAAFTLVQSLERAALFQPWSADVRNAIDAIGWYAGIVSAKIHRALHGLRERPDDGIESDAVQNDWNGSAKVAHLAITESRREWSALFDAGPAPPNSPVRKMIELLDRIQVDLTGRFPRAMEFVRPGFDEPEVAAGALTSRACFEPRR